MVLRIQYTTQNINPSTSLSVYQTIICIGTQKLKAYTKHRRQRALSDLERSLKNEAIVQPRAATTTCVASVEQERSAVPVWALLSYASMYVLAAELERRRTKTHTHNISSRLVHLHTRTSSYSYSQLLEWAGRSHSSPTSFCGSISCMSRVSRFPTV